MKTYDQRTQSILDKVAAKKVANRRRNAAIVSISCCLVLVVGLMLFLPRTPGNRTVDKYSGNEYYPLICQLDTIRTNSSNSSDQHISIEDGLTGGAMNGGFLIDNEIVYEAVDKGFANSPVAPDSSPVGAPESYEEITDNQVQGVTEADLIKRSDRYIYYLRNDTLYVYSIAQEQSEEIGSFTIDNTNTLNYTDYAQQTEMYLSQDCSTITILSSCYSRENRQRYVSVISLDVSNPNEITEIGGYFVEGLYVSSRIVDGSLYLVSNYYLNQKPDYSDATTFVPEYGCWDSMTTIPMDDIILPKEPTSAKYTVVSKLNERTLSVQGTTALLSYAGEMYASQENIFLTRSYSENTKENNSTHYRQMTEITRLSYDLEHMKTYHVEGRINNQYNLDELDGILRIVTTTDSHTMTENDDGEMASVSVDRDETNASLFCIDLLTGTVLSSVEDFAPPGEEVQSVRFDGNYAYVCTSVVLSDPVFFFDLSDLYNITYKDTGTISGYSMSLVDFADGFLMGIGYGDDFNTLKIELYNETASTVESYCKYERPDCSFATNYKAYYIDRENQLVGLGVNDWEGCSRYILLQFDGYELIEVVSVPLEGIDSDKRAVYIDGYLYMFGETFLVEKVS